MATALLFLEVATKLVQCQPAYVVVGFYTVGEMFREGLRVHYFTLYELLLLLFGQF